ncbi:hypothetical protein [Vibrio sp. WXL103]|uniref:hypothetical protein n=1 Tax=Vibrio sp. WXL103 TaxID=3450710 RepID=UPI003EC4E95A
MKRYLFILFAYSCSFTANSSLVHEQQKHSLNGCWVTTMELDNNTQNEIEYCFQEDRLQARVHFENGERSAPAICIQEGHVTVSESSYLAVAENGGCTNQRVIGGFESECSISEKGTLLCLNSDNTRLEFTHIDQYPHELKLYEDKTSKTLPAFLHTELEPWFETYQALFNENNFDGLYDLYVDFVQKQISMANNREVSAQLYDFFGPIVSGELIGYAFRGQANSSEFYDIFYKIDLTDKSKVGPLGIIVVTIETIGEQFHVQAVTMDKMPVQ